MLHFYERRWNCSVCHAYHKSEVVCLFAMKACIGVEVQLHYETELIVEVHSLGAFPGRKEFRASIKYEDVWTPEAI